MTDNAQQYSSFVTRVTATEISDIVSIDDNNIFKMWVYLFGLVGSFSLTSFPIKHLARVWSRPKSIVSLGNGRVSPSLIHCLLGSSLNDDIIEEKYLRSQK